MNEQFTFEDLENLVAHQGKPAVSIYLPTYRIPTRVQAESLQLKNLLREAEEQLAQLDLRGPEIRAILEQARALITTPEFWRHQKDGLALFLSAENFLRYQVPITFEPRLIVAEGYHLKPLLPILTSDKLFYILAVSQNQMRFLRCTRFSVQEIDPKSTPDSLQEILDEYEIEKQVHFHTSSASPGTGRRAAIYYGHGAGDSEDEKAKVREYFARIDQGLRDYFKDQSAPLVFAGVDYLFPIYREANTHPNLVESSIVGNPETLRAEELHREAWKLIEPSFIAEQEADIEQFHNGTANGLTSTNIEELVAWADQGRIDTVFVDKQAAIWGVYDQAQFKAEVQEEYTPHNRDLTDLVALYTLLRKGNVYLLTTQEMEMEFGPNNRHHRQEGAAQGPAATPAVAAIYRYAI